MTGKKGSRPTPHAAHVPLPLDYAPMEALLVDELPTDGPWQYEPKWDGFRCLAFRDGDRVDLMSKAGKPLSRYFPDLVEQVKAIDADRFVLDGEIVVPVGEGLSFDELLLRIHPAKSRVEKLARERPATLVAFDILVDADGRSLVDEPLIVRREALEQFVRAHVPRGARVVLSPATENPADTVEWLKSLGVGLDGLVAKPLEMPYMSGDRAMRKVKAMRTADCVVGGFRYGKAGGTVGSLLLGLYDDQGLLDHVGFTSNMPRAERAALTKRLEKLIEPPGFTGRAPGGPSRWSTERSAEWKPLRPELVVEVQYDHFSGGRFRHGTSFLRWRPDKRPDQCTMAQVARESRSAMALLGKGRKAG